MRVYGTLLSLPLWGAWIETPESSPDADTVPVAPPMGSVD